MKTFGYVMLGLLILAVLLCAAFGLEWAGIKWYGFFGPKREAVRREVFKQTRSYNEGKLQELVKAKYEYESATDDIAKKAIASAIRHSFAEYDENLIESVELKNFLKKCKYGETDLKF